MMSIWHISRGLCHNGFIMVLKYASINTKVAVMDIWNRLILLRKENSWLKKSNDSNCN